MEHLAYYNDNEPYVCRWLENLIREGLIPKGDVDDRPIQEVQPEDLLGYTQVHLFAGIGGWAYALEIAGWPASRPVWTGSCPCQPFSTAGKHGAESDERHLWPEFFHLIQECQPSVVFGEQVASADGRAWLAAVRADLEFVGYAVGGADLCAAGIGAPHIRQRLWWVADANGQRLEGGSFSGFSDQRGKAALLGQRSMRGVPACRMGDTEGKRGGAGFCQDQSKRDRLEPPNASGVGFWSDSDLIYCADGKSRPVEPGTSPLAHGIPSRVGKLRAYGNAIVPQVAAEFITAFMEIE